MDLTTNCVCMVAEVFRKGIEKGKSGLVKGAYCQA